MVGTVCRVRFAVFIDGELPGGCFQHPPVNSSVGMLSSFQSESIFYLFLTVETLAALFHLVRNDLEYLFNVFVFVIIIGRI